MKMNDLPVCKECGWHWVLPHSDCNPEAGVTAKQLLQIATMMGIEATMHGYGQGRVCLEMAEDFTVVLRVGKNGFELERVHLLHLFDIDDAPTFLASFLTLATKVKFEKHLDDDYDNSPALDE